MAHVFAFTRMSGAVRLSLFLIFLVWPAFGAAEKGRVHVAETPAVVHAIGEWKFQPADKPEFSAAGFADDTWPQIPVQNEWRMHGYDYSGNAWYRLHFTLDRSLKGADLALILAPIASASEGSVAVIFAE